MHLKIWIGKIFENINEITIDNMYENLGWVLIGEPSRIEVVQSLPRLGLPELPPPWKAVLAIAPADNMSGVPYDYQITFFGYQI